MLPKLIIFLVCLFICIIILLSVFMSKVLKEEYNNDYNKYDYITVMDQVDIVPEVQKEEVHDIIRNFILKGNLDQRSVNLIRMTNFEFGLYAFDKDNTVEKLKEIDIYVKLNLKEKLNNNDYMICESYINNVLNPIINSFKTVNDFDYVTKLQMFLDNLNKK